MTSLAAGPRGTVRSAACKRLARRGARHLRGLVAEESERARRNQGPSARHDHHGIDPTALVVRPESARPVVPGRARGLGLPRAVHGRREPDRRDGAPGLQPQRMQRRLRDARHARGSRDRRDRPQLGYTDAEDLAADAARPSLRGRGRPREARVTTPDVSERRHERRSRRPRARQLPGRPAQSDVHPRASGAGERHQTRHRLLRRGLQQHGARAARSDRGLVPHLLG